jgi:hypothetical protein
MASCANTSYIYWTYSFHNPNYSKALKSNKHWFSHWLREWSHPYQQRPGSWRFLPSHPCTASVVKDPAKPTLPGWTWHTHHQRSQVPKTWKVYFKEEGQTNSTEDIDFKCSHDAGFSKCSFHVLGIKHFIFMQTRTLSHSIFNTRLKISVKTAVAKQTEYPELPQFLIKEWVYNFCHMLNCNSACTRQLTNW